MARNGRDRAEPVLFGVLVTHRRSAELEVHLERLHRQTRRVDRLFVVDNAPCAVNRGIVAAAAEVRDITYLPAPENLGPAGGIAMGLRAALAEADDEDWVVLLDDDNPPTGDDVLERVLDFALEHRGDARVGAVGLIGSAFDQHRARFVRLADDQLAGVIDVDWIGGNQFPMVRVAAVRDVGVFREELFWGLEELEFGLRLRAAGYRVLVSGELARRARETHGRLGRGAVRASAAPTRSAWRQFYILRNMIAILREHGHDGVAIRVALTRGVGKAVVLGLRSPGSFPALARSTSRAVADGWRGRLGRTLEPTG